MCLSTAAASAHDQYLCANPNAGRSTNEAFLSTTAVSLSVTMRSASTVDGAVEAACPCAAAGDRALQPTLNLVTNVTLVLQAALNVVYCSAQLIVVNVVQQCSHSTD